MGKLYRAASYSSSNSRQLLRIARQLRPGLGEQLLPLLDRPPVVHLGIFAVVEPHEASDARERDRLVLAPGDVGEVVHRVTAPAELLEELAELLAECPPVVALVELGDDLVRRLVLEQLRQRRTVLDDAAQPPHGAADVDRSSVEPLQGLVGLGLLRRLHDLVVHVAERAARQEHEVDVPVDPPLVGHVLGELVELLHHLGVAQAGVVGRLRGLVLGDDRRLPLLVPEPCRPSAPWPRASLRTGSSGRR